MAYRQERQMRVTRGAYNSRPRPNYQGHHGHPGHQAHHDGHNQHHYGNYQHRDRERRNSNDYHPRYGDSDGSMDAAKMRKFLTYCLLALLIFCIFNLNYFLDPSKYTHVPSAAYTYL